MSLIDDIKNDRKAGTPGPWHTGQCSWDEDTADVRYTLHDVKAATPADARRIARVPDMEAALLAAEELHKFLENSVSHIAPDSQNPKLREMLVAYRKATGADQ